MNAQTVTVASLTVGDSATRRFVVAAESVDEYASLSDDYNPIHVDADYAASTPFGRRVAHGMLVAGYMQSALSSVVAPGGVSKSYSFDLHAPTFVDAVVDATVTCAEVVPARGRAYFDLEIVDVDTGVVVITGRAEVAFKKAEEHR